MANQAIKLALYLARAGVAARRRSEELILQGKVKVNGQIETNVATRVIPGQDQIEYDNRELTIAAERILLALHKPRGVVSTVSDPDGKRTVIDLMPPAYRHYRLFPVGRLDEDSEGLILLTNDGQYAQRLTHPRYQVAKVYQVTIAGRLTAAEIARLKRGVPLKDGRTKPTQVEIEDETNSQQTFCLTLREGRYHEIRRMMKALNHDVLRLRRLSMGPFQLEDLPLGQVRVESFQPLS